GVHADSPNSTHLPAAAPSHLKTPSREPALPELPDERSICQRTGLHAHRFSPATIEILQSVELFLADRPNEPHPNALRGRRMCPAINRKAPRNRLDRCTAFQPQTAHRLRASHGGLRLRELDASRKLDV